MYLYDCVFQIDVDCRKQMFLLFIYVILKLML